MKAAVAAALEALPDTRRKANRFGIKVVAKTIPNENPSYRDTVQFMFKVGRWNLVDWWPGTGTVRVGGHTKLDKVPSIDEALQMAIDAKDLG